MCDPCSVFADANDLPCATGRCPKGFTLRTTATPTLYRASGMTLRNGGPSPRKSSASQTEARSGLAYCPPSAWFTGRRAQSVKYAILSFQILGLAFGERSSPLDCDSVGETVPEPGDHACKRDKD